VGFLSRAQIRITTQLLQTVFLWVKFMINYREYQLAAIRAAINAKNGVCVLPTGSGKSVICAGIVDSSDGGVLVLQPSLEILESNIAKAVCG